MKLITSVLGMGAVIFFAFTANGYDQVDEEELKETISYMVKLDAKWHGDSPEVKEDSLEVKRVGNCRNHDHTGCLLFPKDLEGSITFHLNPSANLKFCPQAKEVITRIEVATEPENQELIKGDFSKKPEEWVQKYAFESIDPNDGVVFKAPRNRATTRVTLTNLNSQPRDMGEKQFWYKVTVTKCGEPLREISTDPRGDNEGRN